MNKLRSLLVFIVVAFMCVSCSVKLADYEKTSPTFDIKDYFHGDVIAWGVVKDYTNKVTKRFCVEINGNWQGNKGVLAEKFYFNDGTISYRNWHLIKQVDGSYTGTAEDVVGTAIGKHNGFAFQFEYQLLLTLDEETYQVTMDDWMYQLDEFRVMNTTSMFKFGLKVADITLFFDKSLTQKHCEARAD